MVTLTLDERDVAVLDQLRHGPHDVAALARETSCSTTYLRTRLPALADNDLVARRDDQYELTESGRRALEGTAAGEADDRLDTPPAVEASLRAMDLRADRAAAVRAAVAVLTTRGAATGEELVDACYSEQPAGYESPDDWWQSCVRPTLRDLPGITTDSGENETEDEDDIEDETTRPAATGAGDASEDATRDSAAVWRYDPPDEWTTT